MKVLVVDNNRDPAWWGARNFVREIQTVSEAVISVRRAPEMDLPRVIEGFDRVIVSGSRTSCLDESEWVKVFDHFLEDVLDRQIPVLGVCFGHQALVRILVGRRALRRAALPEVGWTQIERTETDSILLKGLPSQFVSYSSHYEEATEAPSGAIVTSRSDRCAIQSFEIPDRGIFAVQFHPEKSLEEADRSLRESKLPESQKLFPRQGQKLYQKTVGETIFRNFVFAQSEARGGAQSGAQSWA